MGFRDTLKWNGNEKQVEIPVGKMVLRGLVRIPSHAESIVLFVHGSGSGRLSPRNRFVADGLSQSRHATLLFDLLDEEEEAIDSINGQFRFNIALLAERLVQVTDWVVDTPQTSHLAIGYFGASTGAAAALVAAADRQRVVRAIVSRGGRPDLAGPVLNRVRVPTLLIVGGEDFPVIPLNEEAFSRLPGVKKLEVVPRATHLFEEPGALEKVVELAGSWFETYLRKGMELAS